MMRNSILILGIFSAGLTSLCVSTSVEAAGFQISEHSASATGRAGAVFATVSDPSAVFFNPAGLAKTHRPCPPEPPVTCGKKA
jgi:long-subunit fatty acid transport protein